uniref:DUF4283 domain-containing protein n=1 Tax=Noccaea caerulescens TaxID=107243 RepID=A0A1J3HYR0_NOCCA
MTRKKKKLGKPTPVFSKLDLVLANARSSSKAPLSGSVSASAPKSAASEAKAESSAPPSVVVGDTDLKKTPTSGIVHNPETEPLSSCVKNQDDAPATVGVSISISPQKIEIDSTTKAPTAGNRSKPARKWSSIVSDSSHLEELGTPSQHVSGAPFVLIPDDNIEEAKEEFKEFIFARFHGDAPKMGRVIGVVNAIWARAGPRIFVHRICEGTYLLRVINERTRAILLSRNMWNIAGFPMFVAPWSPDFNPVELPITSAVVLVEFRDVPYLLFNKQSLRRIATTIGKPVSLAPETERKENFEVAKINIRVDLTKTLPSEIVTGFTSGREVLVKVSYPWLPLKCEDCAKYGHATGNCSLRNAIPKPAVMQKKRQQSKGPHRGSEPRPGRSRSKKEKNGANTAEVFSGQELTKEVEKIPVEENVEQIKSTEGGIQSLAEPSQPEVEEGQIQEEIKDLGNDGLSKENAQTEDGASTSVKTDKVLEEVEAPFFLVTRKKSGRKVTPHH